MAVPGQPYPYAYPPGPYAYPPTPYPGPVVMPPRVAVLVPAPPLPSYQWGATVDALFLERSSGGSIPLGSTSYIPGSQLPPAVAPDSLYSDDVPFPLAAGLRLEISRKFDNDITLAATYWGLQQWSVGRTIYGDPNRYTVLAFSPLLQLPTLLNGLDNSLGYNYGSQIENVEFNATLRLNPSDPYWEVDWLCGVRYVYLADNFTLTGSDILNNASEQLAYNTTNNLIGAQTGFLFVHGWSRFQWEAGLKFGLMANIYHQHGTDTASNPPPGFTPYDISNSGSDFSALFEVSVGVRYRLMDNLGLRLGYQFYDITGLALAPRQLGSFGHGGNVALDGFSIGLQATW
jgi:opacity protein-like surface antigen